MKIERLKLTNFKTFRDAEMSSLPAFCVVVGANGAGKSTLFDVFGFLKDCLTYNVTRALQVRGGFHEVVSRGQDEEDIGIELQYRKTSFIPSCWRNWRKNSGLTRSVGDRFSYPPTRPTF